MKKILLLTLMLAMTLAYASAKSKYCGLDPTHPITFLGNKIKYDGKIIRLNEHAIYVDGNLPENLQKKYEHVYRSFNEAVENLVDGTEEEPMCVYIAPYVYWVNDPDTPAVVTGNKRVDPIGMVVKCENLHLIGLTEDARNIVLASKRGHTQGASGNFTMFEFWGDGLQVSNMTLGNFCNVDMEYALKPELSIKKRSAAITQAHVAYSHGDKVVARNVNFISRLNMNPLSGAKRLLFDHCHMECTDDALAGNGVYLSCTIDLYGQKPFYTTNRCGAVFLDCDFTVYSGSTMTFTKMSGPLTLINCRYKAAGNTTVSWTRYPDKTLRCYTSNFLLNGNPYKIGANNPQNTIDISDKPLLDAFVTKGDNGKTFYNISNLLGGNDGWTPIDSLPKGKDMPTALLVDNEKLQLRSGEGEVMVKATPMRHSEFDWNGSHKTIHWRVPEEYKQYIRLSATEGDSITIKSVNETDTTVTFCVEAYTDEGLHAAVEVTAKPSLLPQPAFTQEPRIVMADDGKTLRVEYSLDLQGRKDLSEITWLRATKPDGSDAIPIIVSRNGVPEKTYHLTAPDNNCYIIAIVEPSHLRSRDEDKTMNAVMHVGNVVEDKQMAIDTDFHTMPTSNQPRILPGYWTLDGCKPLDTAEYEWPFDSSKDMWKYGEGIYGAIGFGLLQAQRGARLMYQPSGTNATFGDMSIILDVDPTKNAGQGFGSATGQYMDVCIKFDPYTLTGYALRIIRTPKHNKAVDFLLIKYENGKTEPITEAITAGCYRTGCTILLEVKGNQMTANVITSKPLTSDVPLSKSVSLHAEIEQNPYGGFAIQHTGTVGEGTTMLHRLRVDWE